MVSLPGLHLRRSLGLKRKTILVDQYVPKDHKDGLLFALPMRRRAETVYNAGARGVVAPSTQVVDALGSYIHSVNGIITPAQANKLRIGSGIDISSKRKGAIFEGVRTNTFLRSEELNLSPWAITRASISENTVASPDGNSSADKLVEDSSSETSHLIAQSITVTLDQRIVVSVFAKKSERFILWLLADGMGAPSGVNVFYDLNSGVRGNVAGGVDDSGMNDLGNGWYRCWFAFTANANDFFRFALVLAIPTETFLYTGDGSSGLYLWGAQCDENADYPLSYIKNEGSATTRAADDIDYDNADEVNVKAAAGTIYIASTPQWEGTEGGQHWIFSIKTADDGVQFFHHQDDGNTRFNVSSGGVSVASLDDGFTLTRGTTYVWALVWAANDFRLYRDGVLVASDDAGDAPTAMATRIHLGQNASNANQADANLAHFHSYDSAHATPRILRNTREIQAFLGV